LPKNSRTKWYKEGLTILKPKEEIDVFSEDKQKHQILAQIDTGRFRSAIASEFASDLSLIDLDDLLWFQQESGEGKVPVVEIKFKLKDKLVKTAMVVSKKLNKSRYKVVIGRKDLDGFLVSNQEVWLNSAPSCRLI
jgi:hypothetical protein